MNRGRADPEQPSGLRSKLWSLATLLTNVLYDAAVEMNEKKQPLSPSLLGVICAWLKWNDIKTTAASRSVEMSLRRLKVVTDLEEPFLPSKPGEKDEGKSK